MSGRGMIPSDVPMLVELACRLREETHGCGTWDRPGVAAQITSMRTWNLEVVVEQILRRCTDPEARTPAALLHKISSPLPSERPKARPQPPKKAEECPLHMGQPKPPYCASCATDAVDAYSDHDTPDLPPLEEKNPRLAARLKALTTEEDAACGA